MGEWETHGGGAAIVWVGGIPVGGGSSSVGEGETRGRDSNRVGEGEIRGGAYMSNL